MLISNSKINEIISKIGPYLHDNDLILHIYMEYRVAAFCFCIKLQKLSTWTFNWKQQDSILLIFSTVNANKETILEKKHDIADLMMILFNAINDWQIVIYSFFAIYFYSIFRPSVSNM